MAENQREMNSAKCGYLMVSPPLNSYSLTKLDSSGATVGQEVNFIKIGDYDESQVTNRVTTYVTHNPAFEWRHIAVQNYRNHLFTPRQDWKIGTRLRKSVLVEPNFEPPQDGREWFRTINRRAQLGNLLKALDNVDVAQEVYREILWKLLTDGRFGEMKAQLMKALEGLDRQQWIVVCQWFETLGCLLGQIKEESERPKSENPDIIKQIPWTIKRVEESVQACMSVIYPTQPQNFIHALQNFEDPTPPQYPNNTLRNSVGTTPPQYFNNVLPNFVDPTQPQYPNIALQNFVDPTQPQYFNNVLPNFVDPTQPQYPNIALQNFVDPTQPQYFNNILPNFVDLMKEDPLKPLLLAKYDFQLRLSELEKGLSDSMQRLNDITRLYDINVSWLYDNVNILVAANSKDEVAFLNESVAILFFDYILNGRE